MPRTGNSSSNRRGSAGGACLSYTDHGAPERTMPTGSQLSISFSEAVHGSTTEKTFCSRIRRAISCVYWAPKSRITMDWLAEDGLSLDLEWDWGCTDEFLKSADRCKGAEDRSGLAHRGRWLQRPDGLA